MAFEGHKERSMKAMILRIMIAEEPKPISQTWLMSLLITSQGMDNRSPWQTIILYLNERIQKQLADFAGTNHKAKVLNYRRFCFYILLSDFNIKNRLCLSTSNTSSNLYPHMYLCTKAIVLCFLRISQRNSGSIGSILNLLVHVLVLEFYKIPLRYVSILIRST